MPVTELIVAELSATLEHAAADVLETMFFTEVIGETGPAIVPGPGWITACLNFHGKPSGKFAVSLPLETGTKIAANFLGADGDDITEALAVQVICELCNMLCGSVLSRIEKDVLFDLTSPQRCEACQCGGLTTAVAVHLKEGPVAMQIRFDP
jgi:CheY-specific phosphatase CheX